MPAAPAQAGAPFDGSVVVIDAPSRLGAGDTASAVVEVTNRGQDTWVAGGPVRVAYHLRDAKGGLLHFDGERTLLPADVAPGGTLRLCARLRAPDAAGPVLVEWDLVHEGVTWLSQQQGRPLVSHRLAVVKDGAGAARWPAVAWLFITLAHTVLSVVWAMRWRRRQSGITNDEVFFVGTTVWLGSLSIVLHVAAAAGAISLESVGIGLCIVQAVLHWRVRSAPPAPDAPTTGARWLERAGLTVLMVIATQWISGDVRTPSIGGTDAAHYHVPHAVNLALGGSLFDMAATPHLYPMGTSVLAAWCILPVESGLLVDSATLPSFILLVAALGWLFRQMTGWSGLAVVPWFSVGLLTLPIVRISASLSADLPSAAAFIALVAHVLALLGHGRASTGAILVIGVLAGLLAGSKTTGVLAVLVLLGLLVAGLAARHRRRRWTMPGRQTILATVAAIALAVAAGGIWQVRNWWNYGSPLAPIGLNVMGTTVFPGQPYDTMREHLSVARDLDEEGGVRVWRTARRHLRNWAGPWLLLVGWLTPLVMLDALLARRQGLAPALARARLTFIAIVLVSSGILVWFLVGAPWTSLRWTNGLSLRYVLQTLVLGAFLVPLAMFPLGVAVCRTARGRLAGTLCLALASVVLAVATDPPPEQDLGGHLLNLTSMSVAIGVAATMGLVALSRSRRLGPLVTTLAVATCCAALLGGSALASRANRATLAADLRLHTRSPCRGGLADDSPHRAVARLIDAHQRQLTSPRAQRRVFVAARFDVPLSLQGAAYDARVFDARGLNLIERELASSGPGTGRSDYIVASIAELATDRGAPLVSRTRARTPLVELGDAGPYRVWYVTPLASGGRRQP